MRRKSGLQLSWTAVISILIIGNGIWASDWFRFRGPGGSGVADARGLPVVFGDGLNMAWKAPIPQGKSSPVLTDRLIFLTAHEGEHLLVLAYDREMGKLLWRRSIEKRHNESRNSLNDAAASTPVTDGHNVFVFFSEAGLASYDSEGNKRWFVPLGPFDSEHGISTSPILVDEKVVLMIDQIGESYIVAFDSRDGRQAWKTEKLSVMGGYSTPASYEPSSGPAQIIGISPVELAGYSAQSGERLWWVHGLSYQSRASPAIGAGKAYATTSGFGGGPAWPFEKLAEWGDKNKDDKVSIEEVGANPHMTATIRRWGGEDQAIDAKEWEESRKAFSGRPTAIAVSLDGEGDVTESHVRWRFEKALPSVSSPLYYSGVLYFFKDGGIVTALDPKSGKVLKQGRIRDAIDKYYSSPVAADGKIYVGSETGQVSVLRAGKDWEVLAVNNLEEDVYATPALAGDRVYLRTSEYLYCFAVHDLVQAVRDGDLERTRKLLARADVPGKTLNLALLEATEAKNTELTTLLREAGAATAHSDEEPVVPEKRLAAYAGHFQTEKGWKAEIVLEDGVLLYKRWGSESRLEPISSTSFKVPEKTVIMLEFEIDGDRIVGFTHKHPDRPATTYKRAEAKQSE